MEGEKIESSVKSVSLHKSKTNIVDRIPAIIGSELRASLVGSASTAYQKSVEADALDLECSWEAWTWVMTAEVLVVFAFMSSVGVFSVS